MPNEITGIRARLRTGILLAATLVLSAIQAQAVSFDQAVQDYKDGKYEQALPELESIKTSFPNNPVVHYLIAGCHEHLNHVELARKEYQWVSEHGPEDLKTRSKADLKRLSGSQPVNLPAAAGNPQQQWATGAPPGYAQPQPAFNTAPQMGYGGNQQPWGTGAPTGYGQQQPGFNNAPQMGYGGSQQSCGTGAPQMGYGQPQPGFNNPPQMGYGQPQSGFNNAPQMAFQNGSGGSTQAQGKVKKIIEFYADW